MQQAGWQVIQTNGMDSAELGGFREESGIMAWSGSGEQGECLPVFRSRALRGVGEKQSLPKKPMGKWFFHPGFNYTRGGRNAQKRG